MVTHQNGVLLRLGYVVKAFQPLFNNDCRDIPSKLGCL